MTPTRHATMIKASALAENVLSWFKQPHPSTVPGGLDFDAIQRLAETSPHLLEDIGIRPTDPRFKTPR